MFLFFGILCFVIAGIVASFDRNPAVPVTLGIVLVLMSILLSFHPIKVYQTSEGDRTGLITKLSHKGIFCKTWEGKMLIGNGSNVDPETFYFTVKDKAVVDAINAKQGQVATLGYNEFLYTNSCWGDTSYEITDVK